jgi:hypothetical protein
MNGNLLEVNINRMLHCAPHFVERFLVMRNGAEREGKCVTVPAPSLGDLLVFDYSGEEESAQEILAFYVNQGIPKMCFKVMARMPDYDKHFDSELAA